MRSGRMRSSWTRNCWGATSAADAGNHSAAGGFAVHPVFAVPRSAAFGPRTRPMPGIVGDIRDASVRLIVRHLFDRPDRLPRVNAIRAELGVLRLEDFSSTTSRVACRRRQPSAASLSSIRIRNGGDLADHIGACVFEPTTTTTSDWYRRHRAAGAAWSRPPRSEVLHRFRLNCVNRRWPTRRFTRRRPSRRGATADSCGDLQT